MRQIPTVDLGIRKIHQIWNLESWLMSRNNENFTFHPIFRIIQKCVTVLFPGKKLDVFKAISWHPETRDYISERYSGKRVLKMFPVNEPLRYEVYVFKGSTLSVTEENSDEVSKSNSFTVTSLSLNNKEMIKKKLEFKNV